MSELVEGARLEIVCTAKSGTEGSNPSLSAKKIQPVRFVPLGPDLALIRCENGRSNMTT